MAAFYPRESISKRAAAEVLDRLSTNPPSCESYPAVPRVVAPVPRVRIDTTGDLLESLNNSDGSGVMTSSDVCLFDNAAPQTSGRFGAPETLSVGQGFVPLTLLRIGWDIAVDPVCDTDLVGHGHDAHQGARA